MSLHPQSYAEAVERAKSLKRRKPLAKVGKQKPKRQRRFKAFLASAAWKKIRAAALARAGHRCQQIENIAVPMPDGTYSGYNGHVSTRCPATVGLTVHHKTYARFGGDELPEDLVVLCKAHHDALEASKPQKGGRAFSGTGRER